MFSLIQRGQRYVDAAGYPVEICFCSAEKVVYRREDKQTRSVSIWEFNQNFERLEYHEYMRIKAEMEQTEHLRELRSLSKQRR
ncbi:TPA: DUF4222 domain-containing protein [Escherichia coli]|uniref:DUF4222 domain-containing protein n=1 Tax=Escherichia coli TaxID=562 RepID=UPI0015E9D09C|nr:DUF4222 domain-containing protein [Escherichia coli]EFH3308129.1 DUF4222 domain-containing protein [Escherichia coli]EJJ0958427.1 DUF4222 domain-containing protein [Escherichia coli]EJV8882868.1 DUF4222 domain-containing protein [Escherichia coli]MCV5585147.1 DUF4222 domain-containing protein [Escherichia coli]MDY5573544.1 DUF4222 domain-containing protein [Escherichia coli]